MDRARARNLIGAEFFKLRRRPMLWILLLIQLGLSAVTPMLMYLVIELSDAEDLATDQGLQQIANDRLSFPGVLISTIPTSISWGMPLLIVLAASTFGGEFAWGTLRMLLSRGEGRREYCISKAVGTLIAWMLILFAGVAASFASGTLATSLAGGQGFSAIGSSDIATFAGRWLAAMLAGAAYISFVALIAMQTRSTAFSLAIGLVIFFADRFIGSVVLELGFRPLELFVRSGLNVNIGSLTGEAGSHGNPVLLSIIVLMLYCTFFLMGAIRILKRIDVNVSGVG